MVSSRVVVMPIAERVAISRRHNPYGHNRVVCLSNVEMNALILDLYGLSKTGDDQLDLTFEVVDEKKYMMYLLRGLV
jgi:hypothetical protein